MNGSREHREIIVRRPIAFILAFFAGGIFLGYYLKPLFCILLWGSVLLVLGTNSKICNKNLKYDKAKRFYIYALIIFGISGTFYLQVLDSRAEALEDHQGNIVTIEGHVISIDEKADYLGVLLNPGAWSCGEKTGKANQKLLVNIYFPKTQDGNRDGLVKMKSDLYGHRIKLKGRLTLPSGMRNPGLFDYRLYLKTRGVFGIISAQSNHVEILEDKNLLVTLSGTLKSNFSSHIDGYMDPDTKSLLLGIMFGDKGLIDDDIYEDFQRNGCAHILSVSGIHVSIIYVYISMLFKNRRNPAASVSVILLLLFYAALADFSASVVRAVSMIVIHMLSKHLHRKYDLLCCICFSALIMLVYNPFYLFNIGFQLSYLAVLTLAFALPPAESKISSLSEKSDCNLICRILRILAPVFVIQIGMAPITARHFCYFSFAAFIINLPIIAMSGFVLPFGVVLMIFSIFGAGGHIFGAGVYAIELMIQVMIMLNRCIGGVDMSSMNVKAPSIFVLTLYYGLFFFLTSEGFWILLRKRDRAKVVRICISILCIAVLIPFVSGEYERCGDIVFIDVGQGDCIHVRTPGGKNILIDGGGSRDYDVGKKVLLPYLLKNGANKVDLAIVTHLHLDHYGGIASLCKLIPVKKLAVYAGNLLREDEIIEDTGLEREKLMYVGTGDRIELDNNVSIEILYPDHSSDEVYKEIIADGEDENRSSLIIKVIYKGISVLITGDMGFDGEDSLMLRHQETGQIPLKCDILKVGHHGSRYSTGDRFLDAVDPRAAVIQVGKNNFGHPHPDIIEKLSEKGIMIYRNDNDGAVLINFRRGAVGVRTML